MLANGSRHLLNSSPLCWTFVPRNVARISWMEHVCSEKHLNCLLLSKHNSLATVKTKQAFEIKASSHPEEKPAGNVPRCISAKPWSPYKQVVISRSLDLLVHDSTIRKIFEITRQKQLKPFTAFVANQSLWRRPTKPKALTNLSSLQIPESI